MSRLSRRQLLGTSLAAGAALTLPRRRVLGNVLGANEKINIAVAGLNGRGGSHVGAFGGMDDVEITYLVDPDTRTFANHIKYLTEKRNRPAPKTVQDIRKALDDKNVHAIAIATPNHWHSLMTLWAIQAGKDVYCEKPMCHNAREGQLVVRAIRKTGRVVQHGTQRRSDPNWAHAIAAIRSGKLGKLKLVKGLCYKRRKSIGEKPITEPPAELDFDLWLGPAPEQPHHGNLVHYNWHWFWDFGNGDIGNQGVHQMDVGHWGLPEGSKFPRTAISLGGRFGYTDQGQTPNTQLAIFDYDGVPFIFEVRGLDTERQKGVGIGNIFVLEHGEIREGRFYPNDAKKNEKGEEQHIPLPEVEYKLGTPDNFRNFIDVVRSRKLEDLNAPMEAGYYPSAICELANASYRVGQKVPFSRKAGFAGNAAATEAIASMEEHLVRNGIKLEETEYQLGQLLTLKSTDSWVTDNQKANEILAGARQYRKGYDLPDRIA